MNFFENKRGMANVFVYKYVGQYLILLVVDQLIPAYLSTPTLNFLKDL